MRHTKNQYAGVMELADVTDSKSVGLIPRVGSSPTTGTKNRLNLRVQPIFYPSRSFLITTPKGVYIIKVGKADLVSHHASACISCGLMRYNALRW